MSQDNNQVKREPVSADKQSDFNALGMQRNNYLREPDEHLLEDQKSKGRPGIYADTNREHGVQVFIPPDTINTHVHSVIKIPKNQPGMVFQIVPSSTSKSNGSLHVNQSETFTKTQPKHQIEGPRFQSMQHQVQQTDYKELINSVRKLLNPNPCKIEDLENLFELQQYNELEAMVDELVANKLKMQKRREDRRDLKMITKKIDMHRLIINRIGKERELQMANHQEILESFQNFRGNVRRRSASASTATIPSNASHRPVYN